MGTRMERHSYVKILVLFFSLSLNALISSGTDAIIAAQCLFGNNTITSNGGNFELGFFRPGMSNNYYLGIWYKAFKDQNIVWVANRNSPLSSPFSELKISEDGNLVLFDESKIQVWSTNLTSTTANTTRAVLLDSGNLVLTEGLNSSDVLWQSFDHPTDTWLPGAKVGVNKIANKEQILTSWRSKEDPATGFFSLLINPSGTPQLLALQNESQWYWASEIWHGNDSRLYNGMPLYGLYNFSYVSNQNERYFTYFSSTSDDIRRIVLDPSGIIKQFSDSNFTRNVPDCTDHAYCGAYSICNNNQLPVCKCIDEFQPRFQEEWKRAHFSGGCVRRTPLQCGNGKGDNFSTLSNTNLEHLPNSIKIGSFKECRRQCLSDCSCTAFSYYPSRCLIWQGDLIFLPKASNNCTRYLYYRVALSSEIEHEMHEGIIVGTLVGAATLLGSVFLCVWMSRRKQFGAAVETVDDQLVLYGFTYLKNATKNFSEKLGEGGFGTVYRGDLSNSAAIAVKKLNCRELGEQQFRNEVRTIGVIQHVNLVRLRGFCAEGSNRLLVYEYMPNGSLASNRFRKAALILDWKTRYQILIETARGLAYLHEKCRECIIHCDVKPENILLDEEFHAKIADFGLAKLFDRKCSRVLTTMRGTRGYIAPEWISGEAVTPKADVYSYGMMVFEIISGRRNMVVSEKGSDDYFPIHAVNETNRGEVLSLPDQRLEGNVVLEELTRACRVASWCIQADVKSRPSMGLVVQMLEGVIKVGVPPAPRFLQVLASSPTESYVYVEPSPITSSQAGHDVRRH